MPMHVNESYKSKQVQVPSLMMRDDKQPPSLQLASANILLAASFRLLVWTACFLLLPQLAYSKGVQLVHQSNPKRIKKLSTEKVYIIVTKDTIYDGFIAGVNDSGLQLLRSVYSGRDTARYVFNQILIRDTVYIRPLYVIDTVVMPLADVYLISRPLIGETRYLEPFGWVFVGAVLGIAGLPATVIQDGGKMITEWFRFEMILLSASVPFIMVAGLKKEFDLRHKWRIEKQSISRLKGTEIPRNQHD